MIYPASIVIAVLEIMSYESWLTITGFPCSATIREGLANNLVDVGFIYLQNGRYGLTPLGEQFLNNYNNGTTI